MSASGGFLYTECRTRWKLTLRPGGTGGPGLEAGPGAAGAAEASGPGAAGAAEAWAAVAAAGWWSRATLRGPAQPQAALLLLYLLPLYLQRKLAS